MVYQVQKQLATDPGADQAALEEGRHQQDLMFLFPLKQPDPSINLQIFELQISDDGGVVAAAVVV